MQDLREIRPLRAAAPPAGLCGTLRLPASPALAHRALVLAALAVGETTLGGMPENPALHRTAAALRALGATLRPEAPGRWRAWGRGIGGLGEPAAVLRPAAATVPLFCGLMAGHPGFAVLEGDDPAPDAAWHGVLAALAAGGARFAGPARRGLPLAVEGAATPRPLHHRLGEAGEQPALLLFGLLARGTTVLEAAATTPPDPLEALLLRFGASLRVSVAGPLRVIALDGQPELAGTALALPGDPAAAAVAAVAALLVPGSQLRLPGVAADPALAALLAALRDMGGALAVSAERGESGLAVADLAVTAGPLRALDLAADRLPALGDTLPLLAVAAAGAAGTSRLRGVGQGASRDGGRLDALRALLHDNGVPSWLEGDDLVLRRDGPPLPGGGQLAAGSAPGLAAAALVLGLAAAAPVLLPPDAATSLDTTFPGLVALLNGAAGGGAIGSA